MDLLRWILLGIGLILILAVWWHGRRQRPARQESLLATARRRWRHKAETATPADTEAIDLHEREAPDLGLDADELNELFGEQREAIESRFHAASQETPAAHERKPLTGDEDPESRPHEPTRQAVERDGADLDNGHGVAAKRESDDDAGAACAPAGDADHQDSPAGTSKSRRTSQPEPAPGDEERIIALYVVAPRGERLRGADLQSAFSRLGLEHGDLDIFHRHDDQQRTVFSVANAAEPGTFDPASMRDLETPGVALFMRLPAPMPAPDAFDELVTAARALAADVDGHALDGRQSTLTRQTEQAMRDDMRDYELRRNRAGR